MPACFRLLQCVTIQALLIRTKEPQLLLQKHGLTSFWRSPILWSTTRFYHKIYTKAISVQWEVCLLLFASQYCHHLNKSLSTCPLHRIGLFLLLLDGGVSLRTSTLPAEAQEESRTRFNSFVLSVDVPTSALIRLRRRFLSTWCIPMLLHELQFLHDHDGDLKEAQCSASIPVFYDVWHCPYERHRGSICLHAAVVIAVGFTWWMQRATAEPPRILAWCIVCRFRFITGRLWRIFLWGNSLSST